MKEFKAESKRLMELMINSIYTNKEIFLREIISNASDAIDKLHYESLTNKKMKVTLIVSDNGIGMSKEELEKNLGTIAKSGSFDFKNENKKKENIDIIGQFGVGFYSAFMVASKVEVISKAYGSDEAYSWASSGIDGYEIKKANKESYGTDIIITIKDEEEYNRYLEDFEIRSLIKKYSDYITYPIKMEEDKKLETINSLIPLWRRNKKEVSEEEYNTFYSDKFFDYEKPLSHLHIKAEGLLEYASLLYIPSHASYDYYSKEYEKGLQLYSNGVLIMEKCGDLLPDYFSFVKGVVDSSDLSLNISREMLQQNRVLKTIASNIEKHVKSELLSMQKNNREDYLKFWGSFGLQIKAGIYDNFGMDKEKLEDLLMFYSSKEDKMVTLDEYLQNNQDEKDIYYACGSSVDQIKSLPQVENLIAKDKDVLLCTTYLDEFTLKAINKYQDKEFKNVCSDNIENETEEEPEVIIPEIQIVDVNSKSRPYAVMINNLGAARPYHTGLQSAYLVYELMVEGGITRYLALFKDNLPAEVGSVRSARHYYLDYALENDAYYVHWGWSPKAESDIKTLGINNLNGLTYSTPYFFRKKLNVSSEHTGFVHLNEMPNLVNQKKYRTTTDKGLLFNYSPTNVNLVNSKDALKIDLKYSSGFTTNYEYDASSNSYKQ